jgi:hypothetical protein
MQEVSDSENRGYCIQYLVAVNARISIQFRVIRSSYLVRRQCRLKNVTESATAKFAATSRVSRFLSERTLLHRAVQAAVLN